MHRHALLPAFPYDLLELHLSLQNTKGVRSCLKYSEQQLLLKRCICTTLALANTAAKPKPNSRAKNKSVRCAAAPSTPRCTVQYVSVCIQCCYSSSM
jgi:hypothetical protein